jgi:hypothetical protein
MKAIQRKNQLTFFKLILITHCLNYELFEQSVTSQNLKSRTPQVFVRYTYVKFCHIFIADFAVLYYSLR